MIRYFLPILLLLSACREMSVVQDVDQIQANEIVTVLNTKGIVARADRAVGKSGYSVSVRDNNYLQAVSIITQQGLPAEKRYSFSDIVEQNGIFPNSRELEALKLDRALAAQIEELLANNSKYNSSRCIIRYNSLKEGDTTASLFAKSSYAMTEVEKEQEKSELSKLIKQVVPAIEDKNIYIVITSLINQGSEYKRVGVLNDSEKISAFPLVKFLYYWEIPEKDYDSFAVMLLVMITLSVTLGAIIGYFISIGAYAKTKNDKLIAK